MIAPPVATTKSAVVGVVQITAARVPLPPVVGIYDEQPSRLSACAPQIHTDPGDDAIYAGTADAELSPPVSASVNCGDADEAGEIVIEQRYQPLINCSIALQSATHYQYWI